MDLEESLAAHPRNRGAETHRTSQERLGNRNSQAPAQEHVDPLRAASEVTTGNIRAPTDGVTISSEQDGQLIAYLNRRLGDIERKMTEERSKHFGKLESRLLAKMDAKANLALQNIQDILKTSGALSAGSGSRYSDRQWKRKEEESKLDPAMFASVVMNHKDVTPLLFWTMLSIVGSFASRVRPAQRWLGEDVARILARHSTTLKGASGFAACLYSNRQIEQKQKFVNPVGRIWSFILRNAISSIIAHAVVHVRECVVESVPVDDFENAESAAVQTARNVLRAPAWLKSMEEPADAFAVVNQVFCAPAETSRTGRGVDEPRGKRRRPNLTESELEESRHGVWTIRKFIMGLLNYGRLNTRKVLCENLLFLLDKIYEFKPSKEELVDNPPARDAEFQFVADAAEDGYEFVFNDENTSWMEEQDSDVFWEVGDEGHWDIPNAKVTSVKRSREKNSQVIFGKDDQENLNALKRLPSAFPCLSVVLKYKKDVVKRGTEDNPNVQRAVEEEVHLHAVARQFLMELYRVGESRLVLGASPLSLKAIHVVAIAIRDAIRTALGLAITKVEEIAMGTATCEREQAMGDVTLSLRDGGVELASIVQKKLTITWTAYIAEEKKRKEKEAEAKKAAAAAAAAAVAESTQSEAGFRGVAEQEPLFEDFVVDLESAMLM